MAELNAQIVRQLEFYFSRANLSQDKFMVEQITTGPDRFISLETMLKFNKLKSMTEDKTVIVEALAASATGSSLFLPALLLLLSFLRRWSRQVPA